jgi:hypothetical protein
MHCTLLRTLLPAASVNTAVATAARNTANTAVAATTAPCIAQLHNTAVAAAVGMRTEGGGILSSMAAIDVLLMAVYFAVLAAAHKSVDLQRMFRPSHKQEAPEMPNKVRVLVYQNCCVMMSHTL